jgi:hypothetical protein
MFKNVMAMVCVLGLAACGDGGAGAASGSAAASNKPAASGSAKPAASAKATATATASASAAPAGEVTQEEFLKQIELMFKAISDNTDDCKKMAEAMKAVQPNEEREKQLDAFEAKAKADPEMKKKMDEAVKKLEEANPKIVDGMKKCATDPEVSKIMENKKDEKPEEKK